MLDTNISQIRSQQIQANSQAIKVLLWDIDGTLIRSNRRGAFKEYFAPVMKQVFGSAGNLSDLQVSGMTDTQIFYEALRNEGFTPQDILAAKSKLFPIFQDEMTKFIENHSPVYQVLDGAEETLQKVSKMPNFINGLLTGNFSIAAKIKLETVGLWQFFENTPGLYGEISHDRRELGKNAVDIFSEFLKTDLRANQFVLIGDTPNDIAAARAFGAKVVSVATGRNHPAEELQALKPDYLLENLSDPEQVVKILEAV